MKKIISQLKTAFLTSIVMMIICGLIYPFAVTALAQLAFHDQANGSLIKIDNRVVGSKLIGQNYKNPAHFISRVSSVNYNIYEKNDTKYAGVSSGNFNYAPSNPELTKRITNSVDEFLKENPTVSRTDIPADLMTSSGSGLDPHISIAAAEIQIDRIAAASHLSKEEIQDIIRKTTSQKTFGVLGEDKMNVLEANILIDQKMK
ncbi:potassium-transporting ATPase subunit KdpC [Rummeliibacillus suwonensis]|uniref:potassium-transporting ATPase subunit KdpC n=1 Tax=Rummeliibacillus suwonensis TaxID=1306154 RepID=UPI0011B70D55|nr:potassium-transporting ATPase subunit KdpC [Rummeliibacillus suwonensis]MBO2535590.1 potassium-transporting ATPase subunit KdpC [Rummeliibacillus suwonensis]